MNWIRNFTIIILVSFISLEALSFVITKFDLFLINETPFLYKTEVANTIKISLLEELSVISGVLGILLTVIFDIKKAALI